MFGELGLPEIALIVGIALLLFGPKKLGSIGKGLGEGIRNFKGAINGTKESVKNAVGVEEMKEAVGVNQLKETIAGTAESLKTIETVKKSMTPGGIKDIVVEQVMKK